MEAQRKNFIYERLLAINIAIEPNNIPSPSYINRKIGECHVAIEEVEKFFIQTSQELSVQQQALNNCEAACEQSKDRMLSGDPEIVSLPSARDREARANTKLKDEIVEIKNYKNEVEDLQGLLGVINVKLKNLSRLNADIKTQLRLMESQMKLGASPIEDESTKELMMQLSKSDMFNGASTEAEETVVQDPTQPLDVGKTLTQTDAPLQFSPPEEPAEEILPDEEDVLPVSNAVEIAPEPEIVDLNTLLNPAGTGTVAGTIPAAEKTGGATDVKTDAEKALTALPQNLMDTAEKSGILEKELSKSSQPKNTDIDLLISQYLSQFK